MENNNENAIMETKSGMYKIGILVLVFAAILAVLSFFIVPSQGGLVSSTELQSTALQNADPKMGETLPIQEVGMGSSGRSIIIALVMLTHVLFANLHLGGSLFAIVTLSIYLKNKKERYNRLARSVTLFNVILFSTGATFAVGGVLFFIALYPAFASNLFHLYWWPFLVEAIMFALEILFLYAFWFSWGKISKIWHQVLGYGYVVAVFIQTFLINMVAGGMLTPGTGITWGSTGGMTLDWPTALSWWFNASVWRLTFHRFAASISFFGFLIAMLSMFHYKDRKDLASKREWDWAGSYGVAWGLLGLVFQPVLGLLYMLQIQSAQPDAFEMIMHGSRAWEMLLMVTLLSALFLTTLIYFSNRRERILSLPEYKNIQKFYKIFIWVAAVCAFFLVQPAWLGSNSINNSDAWANPIGTMDFKYAAIFTLVIIGTAMLMIDTISIGAIRESEWGNLSKTSQAAGIMSGALGMWIVIVMGYVRESARSPWLIYNIIPVPGRQTYPTPIPISRIYIVWFIILMVVTMIFWFVSKVTAHHPEKAEEV